MQKEIRIPLTKEEIFAIQQKEEFKLIISFYFDESEYNKRLNELYEQLRLEDIFTEVVWKGKRTKWSEKRINKIREEIARLEK